MSNTVTAHDISQCCMCVWWLQNVSFDGIIGQIRFDHKGDIMSDLKVYQYQHYYDGDGVKTYRAVMVGRYNNSIVKPTSITLKNLDWTAFRNSTTSSSRSGGGGSGNASSSSGQPSSNCGVPCSDNQYAVQLSVACCWRCEDCPADGQVRNERRVNTVLMDFA